MKTHFTPGYANIIIGDFNVEVSDPHMNDFCNAYNLSSLIMETTCYKNPENPSCIDLILTNSPRIASKARGGDRSV